MIRENEIEGLKKRIGSNHIAKISIYFNQHMIFNKFNQPFSTTYISRVFNGNMPNKKVEDGIWRFAEDLKKQEERDAKRKAEILEPVKLPTDED
ncbi:hypothetical protein [Zunongwangia atlantica]|uniref:Uncharacterized protein n=1 Tax=Zunongwangia atlantica 22II14-10F7 TaxID=1185767 RepID=A0A1Y1SYI0_9FLAO|nr:hypothetical protein [Zunongwangia atlantica]ORL43808.1 hypothetical protein IIF7_19189 [Zunongwangia atlantica 22II14-10F7]